MLFVAHGIMHESPTPWSEIYEAGLVGDPRGCSDGGSTHEWKRESAADPPPFHV